MITRIKQKQQCHDWTDGRAVAQTPWGTGGHVPPLLHMAGRAGHRE